MLKRHVQNVHIDLEEQHSQEMWTRYTCDKCNFKTTSEIVLNTHTKTNHEQKMEICDICGKRFIKEVNMI